MRLALALLILMTLTASAQQQTSSSKTRPEDNANATGNVLGVKPDKVLKTEKGAGIVESVDLDQRTVSIDWKGADNLLVLGFAQPTGREQIKVSKKLAKQTGKKSVRLEEVKVGSKVDFEYYVLLNQFLSLEVAETN